MLGRTMQPHRGDAVVMQTNVSDDQVRMEAP
jgi:hypothetical protein